MTMHEDALQRASSQGGWDRRTLLKSLGVGAVAMAGVPLLAACTGGSAPAASGGAKTLTFGSGSSDEVPKNAYKALTDAFDSDGAQSELFFQRVDDAIGDALNVAIAAA